MNLTDGEFLWTTRDKIGHQYPYLDQHIDHEVAIIGGGITGALVAYHFAKAGIDTVLLEKNIVGFGSTKASTSILQYEIDTDLTGLSKMIGKDKAEECFKLCFKAVGDLENIIHDLEDDCGFMRETCLYYTNDKNKQQDMALEYNMRKDIGLEVDYLDEAFCKKHFSVPMQCGVFSKEGAGSVDPYKMTEQLLKKSQGLGLKVYENTEVTEIQEQKAIVKLKTKNGFNVTAKKVIIAEGYESLRYFDEKICDMFTTFTIVTEPVQDKISGWYNSCIMRDDQDPYTYIRMTKDHRIIIGGEDVEADLTDGKVTRFPNDHLATVKKYEILEKKLKEFFPQLKDVKIDFKFNGLFADTTDGLPYIGPHKNFPNCYFTMGYGSNGILYGLLGAQGILADYKGEKTNILELFKFDRQVVEN